MNNIAIVGSEGYISRYLIDNMCKDKNIMRIDKINSPEIEYLDLLSPEQFNYNKLKEIELLVFTAAISGPDLCAKEYESCWNINVKGTGFFIQRALEKDCKVLFFSSDAVFGDDKNNAFDEASETAAITPYGKMKKEIEDCFKDNCNFKSIRLSYVVSQNDKFISYCLGCLKENKVAEVFHPFYRNCITITDVVNVIEFFCNKWDEYPYAFLNVAGIELVSRIRIADEIARKFKEFRYKMIKPEKEFFVNRPAITQMDSRYLYSMHIITEKSFTEKLKSEMEEINI